MFEEITKILPKLKEGNYGKWIVDRKNKGSPKHPIQLPYVVYSDVVDDLIRAVFAFDNDNPDMHITDYYSILRNANVKLDFDSLKNADVGDYESKTIMALLVGSIRSDRFCEGSFLGCLEAGLVTKWIERLIEIDGEN